MPAIFKLIGKVLAFLLIAFGLLATVVPRYLDRIYYRGEPSGHFDGARFHNPDGDEDIARAPGGGSRAGFFWRYLTGNDERPPWPAAVKVARTRPERRVEGDRMVATWIGHATVLVQTQGLNILTDPVWSEKAGPLGFGPRRVARPGVAFDDLPTIDLVVVSHNHYDHMDVATLKRLWERDRPRIVTSLGNDTILRSAGITATAVDWRQAVTLRDAVRVHVTRNNHWSSRWFTDRNRALWSSFVITLPGGNLFFAGDTGLGDGRWPAEAAALGPVRLALIPIGAFRFVPGQMHSDSHIGPPQATGVHAALGATTSIPIHWGTFRLSYEAYDTPPRLLAATMACTYQTGFAAVPIGQPQLIRWLDQPLPRHPVGRQSAATLARCLDTSAVKALR